MDWPRAKTILIIAFLLLDLYLAYLLFYLPGFDKVKTEVTAADLAALVTLGRHYNVELATQPKPMVVGRLSPILINKIRLDEAVAIALAQRWLGDASQESKQDNGLQFISGSKTLTISQANPYFYTLTYTDASPIVESEPQTKEEAIATARLWLEEYLGAPQVAEYQVNMAVADPKLEDGYVVEFSRVHKGYPIFADSYRLHVQGQQIVSFTAKQAHIGEVQRSRKTIVSADQAVRRYLARLGVPQEEQISILDLSLGYDAPTDPEAAGELRPVWRFYLAGNQEVVIPADHVFWEEKGGNTRQNIVKYYGLITKRENYLVLPQLGMLSSVM